MVKRLIGKFFHSDLVKRAGLVIIVIAFTVPLSSGTALGLSQADLNSIIDETPFYDPNAQNDYTYCPVTTIVSSPTTVGNINFNTMQIQNIETIIGIAKSDNVGQPGAMIGLMVGDDESTFQNESNTNVPLSASGPNIQATGSNGNSLGIFQQQPDDGWSTYSTGGPTALTDMDVINQLMTPAYAAEAFFGTPTDATLPSGLINPGAITKGLLDINGGSWQNINPPWQAAQDVQESGTPNGSNYELYYSTAEKLLSKYWDSTPAITLPIPYTEGTPETVTTTNPITTSPTTSSCNPGTTTTSGTPPGSTTSQYSQDFSSANAQTQAVIEAGISEVAMNIPYSYGGGGPYGPSTAPAGVCDDVGCSGQTTSGFDCSSFMQFVFYQGAQILLPRSAQDQYNATVGAGDSIPITDLSDLQPGDMMFFGDSTNDIKHVNMYIGGGMVMEAPETGENLHIVPMYTDATSTEVLQGIGYYPPIGQGSS